MLPRILRVARTLWRNREWLGPLADEAEQLAKAGFMAGDIRERIADGVQRSDVVSDDALEKVVKARRRAATGYVERKR